MPDDQDSCPKCHTRTIWMSQDGVARCIGCNEPAAPERVGGLDVAAMRHVEHVVNIHTSSDDAESTNE